MFNDLTVVLVTSSDFVTTNAVEWQDGHSAIVFYDGNRYVLARVSKEGITPLLYCYGEFAGAGDTWIAMIDSNEGIFGIGFTDGTCLFYRPSEGVIVYLAFEACGAPVIALQAPDSCYLAYKDCVFQSAAIPRQDALLLVYAEGDDAIIADAAVSLSSSSAPLSSLLTKATDYSFDDYFELAEPDDYDYTVEVLEGTREPVPLPIEEFVLRIRPETVETFRALDTCQVLSAPS